MTAQLQARYQRLVSFFPPGHRAVYADDMLTALMDSAPAGRRWPSAGTTIDLLKGAAQAWVRRAHTKTLTWQRLTLPPAVTLLALLLLGSRSLATAGQSFAEPGHTPYSGALAVAVMLPNLIWLPLTVAALLGARRAGVRIALVVGVAWPVMNTLCGVSGWAPNFFDDPQQFAWLPVTLIAVAGLDPDHGARQGLRELGQVAAGAAVTGALLIGTGRISTIVSVTEGATGIPSVSTLLLAGGTVLLTLACLTLVARAGSARTGAALIAIAIAVQVSRSYGYHSGGTPAIQILEASALALPLILLICTALAPRPAAAPAENHLTPA